MTANAAQQIIDAPDAPLPPKPKAAKVDGSTTSSAAAHKAADAVGIIREWGKVFSLTATHCTVCGAGLRDAMSVTRGMGPVCSRKHYEIDFPITDVMVMEALGFLHASDLDKPVKLAAKALKTKPRDLCNVLVWWASAHLNETATVLDCAAVMTALGFESLGERVRERNTDVIITKDGEDHFIIRCRSLMNTRRNMARVKEATPVERDGRFKYGWKVSNTRKGLVWTILGEDFGDQWATVPSEGSASKVAAIPARNWMNVRDAFRKAYKPAEKAIQPIVRKGSQGWLEIHTPNRNFNFIDDFKSAIHYQDRTWNRDKVCWTVRGRYEEQVRKMVDHHFGRE